MTSRPRRKPNHDAIDADDPEARGAALRDLAEHDEGEFLKRQGNPSGSPWRSTPATKRGTQSGGRKQHSIFVTDERWAKLERLGKARGISRSEMLEEMIDAAIEVIGPGSRRAREGRGRA